METNRLRAIAVDAAEKITQLQAERENAPDRASRKLVNQRIHILKGMERWLKSRTGYE